MRRAETFLSLSAACCLGACVLGAEPPAPLGTAHQGLTAVPNFGSNPGGLAMYLYAPAAPLASAPLVVAMHGCGQTASDYVHAGWNALADQYGFYVVYPQDGSDLNWCFLWYDAASNARGQGEALSVKQMVDYMKAHYAIDPARVFVTGLSSGGAMTVAMLADYPEVFAAGAPMSGIAFGCTATQSATTCMAGVTKTAQAWGDYARAADPGFGGPWPRVSIWQGTLDQVVSFANAAELVKQWTDVQGLDSVVGVSETVGPAEHTEYKDPVSGRTMVESWAVQQMNHGVAVDPAGGCGSAMPYVLDVQLCSSLWAAKFFGLVPEPPDAGAADAAMMTPDAQPSAPGRDAATPSADAAVAAGRDASAQAVDAGHAASPGSGCGCGAASGAATAMVLLPLALLSLRRRGRNR